MTRPTLPLAWGVTLAFSASSLIGILAFTSNLAVTDGRLADGVGQVVKIDRTTDRGLVATDTLPRTDVAVQQTTPSVIGTLDSLRRTDVALATMAQQVNSLADVLTDTRSPLKHTVATTADTEWTIERAGAPVDDILDTLRSLDARTVGLHAALDETLRLSRQVEAKLHVLGYLPAGGR